MMLHDVALASAGVLGIGVAVIHGLLTHKHMAAPIAAWAGGKGGLPTSIQKLVPALLQFSTFNWIAGGVALIVVATWSDYPGKLITGLLVGSSYLYGALGNAWATGGRHPGWLLYAMALLLIGFGLGGGD